MTTQFQVGKTYWTRSICDYDTIFSYKIMSRTAKTVTFADRGGETKRRNIFVYDGAEQFRPHGNYSMAAIISADKDSDPDDDLDEYDEYPGEDIDGPN